MSLRRKNISSFLLLLAALMIFTAISRTLNFRFDLTEDRRYTLSEQSKRTLENLDDIVFFRIYLDGEMPVGLKKFRASVKEKFDELKRFAGKNLQYEFINPAEGDDDRRNAVYHNLVAKGLSPLNIAETDSEGGSTQRLIFPGALVNCKGKEMPVNLIHENAMLSSEENLNLALQNLEYEIVNVVQKIMKTSRDKIAFIEGHGELDDNSLNGIFVSLADYYDIERADLSDGAGSLDEYRAVVIAKPMERWAEEDKFVIDQYIMSGGRTAWFIDAVHVYEDTLSSGAMTMGFICEHNLNDQLFNYGVRINRNVIQDLQCAQIKIAVNSVGKDAAGFRLVPWTYFPLLWTSFDNPITRGVNLVKAQYPGVIDTVGNNAGVKKTYLLYSSDKSKVVNAPMWISLAQVDERITEKIFDKSHLPVAALLEGEFISPFRNRSVSQYAKNPDFKFRSKSVATKMIVVSDGDIIRNDVNRAFNPKPLPLGFDRNTGQVFGNREFVTNIINYLADEDGLMNIKNRTVKLRLLDNSVVAYHHTMIIIINTFLPVIAVIVCGMIFIWRRYRKYAK